MSETYYSTIRENFKKWAPIYDAFTVPFKSARQAVVKALEPVQGMTVLDVCTGTGAVALELAKAGATVTAIDLSKDMLKQAQQKPGAEAIRFLRMDATDLMFQPDTFDAATVSWGLHEMPLDIMRRVLGEVHRVARQRLIVFDYRQPSARMLAVAYRFVLGLYEGPYCMSFLDMDLPQIMQEEGFSLEYQRRTALGTGFIYSFRIVK
jgi:ubiquinone/menaquinone biosynthesis C-methylase UbiE